MSDLFHEEIPLHADLVDAEAGGPVMLSTADFGSITLTGGGGFVAKLNSSGEWVWAVLGHSGSGVAVDNAGNKYVTGAYLGTASFGSNTLTSRGPWEDLFVWKIGK